jgi:hypothetical protein
VRRDGPWPVEGQEQRPAGADIRGRRTDEAAARAAVVVDGFDDAPSVAADVDERSSRQRWQILRRLHPPLSQLLQCRPGSAQPPWQAACRFPA